MGQRTAAQAPAVVGEARTVALLTLGCKLNQAETEAMAREFSALGFGVLDRPAAAHGYIINSCAVTHVAERKSRHMVRLARRLSPEAPIVLTGCYPQSAGGAAALDLSDADVVIPGPEKQRSVGVLLAAMAESPARPLRAPVAGTLRTRAFVKTQEGCDDVCAFCIVPYTRGRERSIPPAGIVRAVREREAAGTLEVVVTGTQLGAYGRDNPGNGGLVELISTLLAESSIPRIRISSVQPQDVTPPLLALWEDPRLCRHMHLALQSGCEETLRRMRRRYTADRYRRALAEIRAAIPQVAITTDVIAGFPGETDAEFEESFAFCSESGFAGIHVFPYSRRAHTLAARLPGHVPEATRAGRVRRLLALAGDSARRFVTDRLGSNFAVLWEELVPDEPGVWAGLTDNYIRVFTRSREDLRNHILPAKLIGTRPGGAWGDVSIAVE